VDTIRIDKNFSLLADSANSELDEQQNSKSTAYSHSLSALEYIMNKLKA
jgi:hypothetical protein